MLSSRTRSRGLRTVVKDLLLALPYRGRSLDQPSSHAHGRHGSAPTSALFMAWLQPCSFSRHSSLATALFLHFPLATMHRARFRNAGFQPALFWSAAALLPLSLHRSSLRLPFRTRLLSRHSFTQSGREGPLVTHHCCMVSGDRREVSPTRKVSNHYEPNVRYHTNIRNPPVCPRFPNDVRSRLSLSLVCLVLNTQNLVRKRTLPM